MPTASLIPRGGSSSSSQSSPPVTLVSSSCSEGSHCKCCKEEGVNFNGINNALVPRSKQQQQAAPQIAVSLAQSMTPHQLLMQQMAHLKQQKLTIQQLQLKLQNNMKSRLSGTTDLSTATEKSSGSNKLEPSVASVLNNVESTRHVHGIPKKPMVSCYTVDDQQMDTLLDSSSMSSSSQSPSHWSRHPAAESVLSHDEAQLVMAYRNHQLELQLQAKMLAYNQSRVMIHHHMQQQIDTLLVSPSLPSQPVAMPSFRIINVRTKNANGAWVCMAEGCSKKSQGRTMSTKFSFCRTHHNMYLIQTGQVETWSCDCGNKVATTSDRCGMCHRWKKGMKPSERGQSFPYQQQQHPPPTVHHKDDAFIMNTPTPSNKLRPHLPTPHYQQLMQQVDHLRQQQLKNGGNNASVPQRKLGIQQQQPVVVKKTKPNIKSPTMKKKWNHDVSKVSAKVMKQCSFEGCTNRAKEGGVCVTQHSAKLYPEQPPPNLVRTLTVSSHQLVNLDDEDELGAWIWRTSQTARDFGVH